MRTPAAPSIVRTSKLGLLLGLGLVAACASRTPLPDSVRAATTSQEVRRAIRVWCQQPEHAQDPVCGERLEKAHCLAGGGSWRRFNDGCADSCLRLAPPQFGIQLTCTMDTPMACDCGPSSCWDGARCVRNSRYR